MDNPSDTLQLAIDAAKIGSNIALQYYDKPLDFELKGDDSPVSIADREAESAIKSFISSKMPHVKFLAEESGGNSDEETFWVIDPIDGTRSFLRGIPFWCVLIAYVQNHEVIVGVCYFPLLNLLIIGEKGKGAFCNNKKISVSSIRDLSKAIISYSSPKRFANKEALLGIIEKAYIDRNPDPTYAASLVATGKYEVLMDANAKAWDAAPWKVIIEEAGGKITNMQGNEWTFSGKGYIASNGLLHDEIVHLVNS